LIATTQPGATTGNRAQFTVCGRFIASLPFAAAPQQQGGCYVTGREVEVLLSRACVVCGAIARRRAGAAA